jgi:hypothetical protein
MDERMRIVQPCILRERIAMGAMEPAGPALPDDYSNVPIVVAFDRRQQFRETQERYGNQRTALNPVLHYSSLHRSMCALTRLHWRYISPQRLEQPQTSIHGHHQPRHRLCVLLA